VTLAAAASLTGGWLWVASGSLLSVGTFTVLTLHAWVGLALVPLVIVHLLPRRWRLLRPGPLAVRRTAGRLVTRRAWLAGAGLAAAGIGVFGVTTVVERVRGGERRFTGSRWLPAGGVPPATTFFGEGPPVVDAASWRLDVSGLVERPVALGLPDLRALGETELAAVLDCTSGWAIETGWSGVPLGVALDVAGVAPGASNVTVRSATGWAAYLPVEEARRCLLATGVAGADLPLENGAPIRLVVPDRRGLDWVKWVNRIEVA
jgi:DMSO/TMAO reductase YedYZ molybdopterin-dependent catalytic subunit